MRLRDNYEGQGAALVAIASVVIWVGSCLAYACTPAEQQITAKVAPAIINAVCILAADQGPAEPGWEILVCDVLSPNGGTVTMKLPTPVAEGLRQGR